MVNDRVLWLLVLLLVGCAAPTASSQTEVPDPDTSALEPQVREKIRQMRDRVVEQPDSGAAWGLLGMVFHGHGLEPEALASYEGATRLDPENFRWPYRQAYVLKYSDAAAARTFIERALELNPQYVPSHVMLGEFLEHLQQSEEAAASYKRAVAIDPTCAAAELGLGRLSLARGDLEASVQHLERARALQPRALPVRTFLARVYRRLGREADAEKEARIAMRAKAEVYLKDPLVEEILDESVSTPGYYRRAGKAESQGDLQGATDLYRTMLALNPEDPSAHYNLGNLLFRHGELDEAELHLRRCVELYAPHPSCNIALGTILISRRQDSEALKHFSAPVALEREHGSILRDLGSRLSQEGRTELAIGLLRRSLELEPLEGPARYLGRIFTTQGRMDEAIRTYRMVLEKRPDSGLLRAELAQFLIQTGRYQEAWREAHAAEALGTPLPPSDLEILRRALPDPGA